MDYEKAYKDAVRKIKSIIADKKKQGLTNCLFEGDLNEIFPELNESEDEKIWKTLREIIIDYDPNNEILIKEVGISQKQFLAWLEKQGEQNSTDSYCQENCKGYKETGKYFADGKCKAKRDAERNNIVEQLTAFAVHLQKRGAFRDDLCMDFEHEAQSFIEFREYQNNKGL